MISFIAQMHGKEHVFRVFIFHGSIVTYEFEGISVLRGTL